MTHPVSRRDYLTLAGGFAGSLALPPGPAVAEPVPAEAAPPGALTLLAVGDWGTRGSDRQRRVARAMDSVAERETARFIISLGDNFYTKGVASVTDPHWQESFEQVYTAPSLQVPWYPVLGNHDRNGEAMAQVAYSQLSNRWRMPAPYYWHGEKLADASRADFFFLDTSMIVQENSGLRELVPGDDADDQISWLGHALAASKARWKIVVGHHPIYSGGPHGGSPELLRLVKPLLEQHRVAAYLGGHDHNMQLIVRDNIHYVTCGAGATLKAAKPVDGTAFMAETLGFLKVTLTPQSLAFDFVDADGAVLHSAAVTATS